MAPKLNYALTTDPFPLQVSPATGTPHIAKLTIVASNPDSSQPVTLKGITITIPVGPKASELANTAPSNPVAPTGWKLDDTKQGEGALEYVFMPEDGHDQVADEGLTFTFDAIRINTEPGTAKVSIKEVTSTSAMVPFSVTKFPAGWGQVSFWADKTVVKAGDSLALNWSGPTGATYSIDYYTPQTGVVHVPAQGDPPFRPDGLYQLNEGLERNTTFYLNVEAVIDNSLYKAQQSLTVTVASVKITAWGPDDPVNALDEAVIKWTTMSATTVTIEPDKQTVDAASGKGEFRVKPSSNTTYTLIAEDAKGNKKRVSVTVYVHPPHIVSFKATPRVVKVGSPVTLSWETISSAITSIQPEVGDVAATGSKSVTPATGLTTYTLTAQSQFPPATERIHVVATQPGFHQLASGMDYYSVNAPLVMGNKLFLIDTFHHRAWFTGDDLKLSPIQLTQPWQGQIEGQCSVVFDAGNGPRLWILGGRSPNDSNTVWRSTDESGTSWSQVYPTHNKIWSPRSYFGCVVFKKKIWVFGGRHADGYLNDVWSSPDGRTWTLETESPGWSPRGYFAASNFNLPPSTNQIWFCGGFNGKDDTNEVYYTDDGVHWTKWTTNTVPWSPRTRPLLQQLGESLWLIGGNASTTMFRDIWTIHGPQFQTWTGYREQTPWQESAPATSSVFNGLIWCVGSNPQFLADTAIWYFLPDGPS